MLIIPAIYLQDGKCVSWYKGCDNPQKKVYLKTPWEIAQQFLNEGAFWLHLIDLDGSLQNQVVNWEILKEIRKKIPILIQFGGGVRTEEEVKKLLDLGIDQVILGISALKVLEKVLPKYGPEKIVLGIKAQQMKVVTDLKSDVPLEVLDLAEKGIAMGVTKIVYKDLRSEGTLFHPNWDEIDRLVLGTHAQIFASGGITDLNDLKMLREIGVKGAIVSRAFLEKKLDLKNCIRLFERPVV